MIFILLLEVREGNFYPDAEDRIARVSEAVYKYFEEK